MGVGAFLAAVRFVPRVQRLSFRLDDFLNSDFAKIFDFWKVSQPHPHINPTLPSSTLTLARAASAVGLGVGPGQEHDDGLARLPSGENDGRQGDQTAGS
eukprot:3916610-Rhodomonas_salina.1